MPAATAAFDDPFPFELRSRALLPELRLAELREADPLLRDDADDVRRLEALPLRVLPPDAADLLREAVDLLREAADLVPLPLFELRALEPLRFFGLDPFELRELACLLLVDRVLPWAISPP
jgi:hypothetical protein